MTGMDGVLLAKSLGKNKAGAVGFRVDMKAGGWWRWGNDGGKSNVVQLEGGALWPLTQVARLQFQGGLQNGVLSHVPQRPGTANMGRRATNVQGAC